MAEYEVEATAAQIVHWLEGDVAEGHRRRLEFSATREYTAEPVDHPGDAGLAFDDELAVLTSVGVLEVRPIGNGPRWLLRVRVEDEIGAHAPDDGSVKDEPEPISLRVFHRDFVAPETGVEFVDLDTDDRGKAAFDRLFAEMVTDRHDN